MLHSGFTLPEDAELMDWGVDWLTLSWPGRSAERAPSFDQLRSMYDTFVLRGELGERDKEENQGGYVGRRYGALWLGERKGDVLVRVSSWPARVFRDLLEAYQPKVTRIDVQATLRVMGSVDDVVSRAARSSVKGRAESIGRPWKVHHINGFGDGDTANLGGRSSELYCRVYNKGAESPEQPEYMNCVRFEAECKGDLAQHVWSELKGAGEASGYVMVMLAELFRRRGVPDLGRFTGGERPLWDLPKMQTDTEKQLAWLERNVSGTVRKLMLDGWGAWVYDALGLDK